MARQRPRLGRSLSLGLAFVVSLALAACSTGSAGEGASTAPVATSTVDLPRSYKFEPASITVPAGTSVTWNNHDNFTHSVQFKDGGLPTEPMLIQPGSTATFAFATPGTYHYQCHLHPQQMQGTVTVTA